MLLILSLLFGSTDVPEEFCNKSIAQGNQSSKEIAIAPTANYDKFVTVLNSRAFTAISSWVNHSIEWGDGVMG
jgi:hypothetical protein